MMPVPNNFVKMYGFIGKRTSFTMDVVCAIPESPPKAVLVCVINLKSDGTPINCNFVSMGAINQAVAEPRELFKSAILSNAAKMILVHNHPSGRLEPSKEDTIMTDRILKLSCLLGIPLDDHVIVGGDNSRYFSFREKEIMTMPKISLTQDYHYLEFEERALVAEPGRSR